MQVTHKRLYLIPLILGISMIGAAAVYLICGFVCRTQMTAQAAEIVSEFESRIPERTSATPDSDYTGIDIEDGTVQNDSLPVLTVNGKGIVGILEYKNGNIALPVYSGYGTVISSPRPCYYSGSPYKSDLVIVASPDKGQFDFVDSLEEGDKFTFVDIFGRQFIYTLTEIRHSRAVGIDKIAPYDGMTVVVESLGSYTIIHAKI